MTGSKKSAANSYPADIERMNLYTHAIGILYGLISAYWIIMKSVLQSETAVIGTIIFMFGFLLIFTTSTLYHAYKEPGMKWRMKQADHISIFFMISGSYTPFILIFYKNKEGIMLLTTMWVLTLLGTIFKLFTTGQYRYLSTAIYVLMGMAVFWVSDSFFPSLPKKVSTLLIAGGVFYLVGVLFYLRKSWHYHHPVWHLFVLGGAISHWWALWYALG